MQPADLSQMQHAHDPRARAVNIQSANNALVETRDEAHPDCLVCGQQRQLGLRLDFAVVDDGSVQAEFYCHPMLEGYPGLLHGGAVCSVLDGAMTNCLFAHGEQAVTGELTVRCRHPVETGRAAVVRAWIEFSMPPFFIMKAELIQDEWTKAKATGKFVQRAYFEAKRRQQA
jgi:hypothetical protein